MKAGKLLSQATRSMRRYRLRTTLMMLGIVVGIAVVAQDKIGVRGHDLGWQLWG